MIYSLSTSVIIDTIQATAAFRTLSTPHDASPSLAPLLRRQSRPQLRMMVRNAFADILLSLLPYATDCSIDGEDSDSDSATTVDADGDDTDILLRVELTSPGRQRGCMGAPIRRQLEQAVAMRALYLWILAAGDTARAQAYATLSTAAVSSILTVLTPRPFLRGNP